MRTAIALVVMLCAIPALASAQLAVTFGPGGEVSEVRVGEVVYFTDVAVSIVKPRWAGSLVDQRKADAAAVTVEQREGATIYSAELSGEGGQVGLREVARVTAGELTVEYELTPRQEMDAEVVLLNASLPTAVHAGTTRYLTADPTIPPGSCPATLNADSYVVFGTGSAEWIGFLAADGSAVRVSPRGLGVQFQDNRKWQSANFGLLLQSHRKRLPAGETIRFGLTITAATAKGLEAEARELARNEVADLKLGDNRPLQVTGVILSNPTVETYSLLEVRADVAATYENPFDPEQVAVDAEVTRPDGTVATVPGFYDVPMRLELRSGVERVRPAGPARFSIRYTPTVPGRHRLVLRVTDRRGTVRAEPQEFTAVAGSHPGFVRVAKESPRYFAYDNSKPFFAVGENVCWAGGRTPLADYAAWFKGLGAAGGNWARLWLAYNEKGLEWMAPPTAKPGKGTYLGLGKYALDNAWRLDEVVRLARESGVYLMLCLGTYGEFTEGGYFKEGCWVSNPYNLANGGPCATPADFWTDAQARKRYQQRLRYLVARWGYSPHVFAWEFWNEVAPTAAYEAWVAEMAAYLKRTDPNRHLVSTSYGTALTWKVPEVDFTMTHMYGRAGVIADFTPLIARHAGEAQPYNKPYLLAEFGIDWQKGDEHWDPARTGLNMHNGAWAATLAGAAGSSMLWYWDGYVHPGNLYGVLTPLRRFADTVAWAGTRFVPLTDLTARVAAEAPETFSDLLVSGTNEWGKPPSAEYTVARDGSVQGAPVAMAIGSPTRHTPAQLHTRLTWHVDMPAAGKVIARLGEVCTKAKLRVTVDGEVKLERELTAGEPGTGPWKSARFLEPWKVWISLYDEDIAIDVPAGRHEISFANTEGDWVQIRSLLLPGYRSSRYPLVHLLGLRSEKLLLLWVQNQDSTWRTQYDGRQPGELSSVQLSVPVDGEGTWQVEWWDTFKGEVLRRDTVPAARGRLLLSVPSFSRDVAARVEKV